jgi:hypothetical protein
MIAARQIAFGGSAAKYTAADYIQDGLIAMWDGEWNAGFGVHDPNATVWKDLVGTNDLVVDLTVAEWDHNTLTIRGDTLQGVETDPIHAEFVWRDGANEREMGNYISVGNNKGIAAWWYAHAVSGGNGAFSTNNAGFQAKNQWRSRSFCYQVNNKQYWVNGNKATVLYPVNNSSYGYLSGFRAHSTKPMYVRNIRLYNRALTAEEIAYNYNIDKQRFGL